MGGARGKGEVGAWVRGIYSYAVSAPADQGASQLYYSYRIVKGGGGGGWGGGGGVLGERVRWVGERESL